MQKIGQRILYNEQGEIITGFFCEMTSFNCDLSKYRPKEIKFIDLPFGYNENNFKDAIEYHIDVTKDKNTNEIKDLIIIDRYIEHIETEEEKLRREKEELENQLLLAENNNIDGGIL